MPRWYAWKKRYHDGWMSKPQYGRDEFMKAAELAYSFRLQMTVVDSAVLPEGWVPSEGPIPLDEDAERVAEALMVCAEIEDAAGVIEHQDGEAFAESVLETTRSICAHARKYKSVTEKQLNALYNMCAGLRKWRPRPDEPEDVCPFCHNTSDQCWCSPDDFMDGIPGDR